MVDCSRWLRLYVARWPRENDVPLYGALSDVPRVMAGGWVKRVLYIVKWSPSAYLSARRSAVSCDWFGGLILWRVSLIVFAHKLCIYIYINIFCILYIYYDRKLKIIFLFHKIEELFNKNNVIRCDTGHILIISNGYKNKFQ